jgi:hypothetical protein
MSFHRRSGPNKRQHQSEQASTLDHDFLLQPGCFWQRYRNFSASQLQPWLLAVLTHVFPPGEVTAPLPFFVLA